MEQLLKSLKLGWKMKLEVPLKSDYEFYVIFEAISIAPVHAILKLYAVKGDEHKVLQTPTDLKGIVKVGNEEDALNLVRFFTSPDTHIFFDLYAIEAFKEGENPYHPYGTVPEDLWNKLNLKGTKVSREGDTFIVNRYLIFYPHQELLFPKRLVEVKEYVKSDGDYEMELVKEIASGEEIDFIKMPIE